MEITTETVRKIVTEHPETIPVLERLGIDYCCGGERTLAEACAASKVDPATVTDAIGRGVQKADPLQKHWPQAPFNEITDYIVQHHHAFEREQSERIVRLAATVERVHGENHPELSEVRSIFDGMALDMQQHFESEEEVLFPHLVKLESDNQVICPPGFSHVDKPIREMMQDHDQTGNALHRLRKITRNYSLPDDACASYAELFRSLEAFEQDVHQHVHLENNILFPRALEMAEGAA